MFFLFTWLFCLALPQLPESCLARFAWLSVQDGDTVGIERRHPLIWLGRPWNNSRGKEEGRRGGGEEATNELFITNVEQEAACVTNFVWTRYFPDGKRLLCDEATV